MIGLVCPRHQKALSIGVKRYDAGRLQEAEPCYHEALAVYRGHETTSTLDLANAIRPLAVLKGATGEVEEARRLWLEAQELYRAVGVNEGIEECSHELERLGP